MKRYVHGIILIFVMLIAMILPEKYNTTGSIIHLLCQLFAAIEIIVSSQSFNERKKYNIIIISVLLIASNFFSGSIQTKYKTFRIPTASMKNTIQIGDHIITEKIDHYEPKRFDLIVFKKNQFKSYYIKRCIAIAGDKIKITNGQVILNGKKINEPYKIIKKIDFFSDIAETTVPPHSIFVMGDNRSNSFDSREFGPVSSKDVHYKVIGIYWNSREINAGKYKRFGPVK